MISREEKTKTNLVGVVPIAGQPDVLGLTVPDYCANIGKNYTAIERSIIECAYAGCSSIWVVANDDMIPLVKQIVGDYIVNPESYRSRGHVHHQNDHMKYISVFYTQIHHRDRDRRDSLGWSALHGCLTAFKSSSRISSWLAPKKYYISFPYGVYDPRLIKSSKKEIMCTKENFFVSYEGLTVCSGLPLGFTIFPEDWKKIRSTLKQNCTGGSLSQPLHERWSSKDFSLDKIFKHDMINTGKKIKIKNFSEISTWQNYLTALSFLICKDEQSPIIKGLRYEGIYSGK